MHFILPGAWSVMLVYLVYTDIRERRIPNWVVLPAACTAFLYALLADTWRTNLLGGVLATVVFVLPMIIYGPERAGAGDAKLALFIGLWIGYPEIIGAILLAALAISLLAFAWWLGGTFDRKATVPMAPFFAFGTFTMLAISTA